MSEDEVDEVDGLVALSAIGEEQFLCVGPLWLHLYWIRDVSLVSGEDDRVTIHMADGARHTVTGEKADALRAFLARRHGRTWGG